MSRLYFTPDKAPRLGRKRCVYCGVPLTANQAAKWPGTCSLHQSLPASDPDYMLSRKAGAK